MSDRALTIVETITDIRAALREYIEAAYHIGHPSVVEQRRRLLEEEGVLFRKPFLESTPRYVSGRRFADLDISEAAKSLFALAADPTPGAPLLHDPPYSHQAGALEAAATGDSLVVATGTGSGKTESFLLPILARLATEAAAAPDSFAEPAVRAILLYPMNALVNDQLGRLRLMFGDARVTNQFIEWSGRPVRFARYTSRTLYPGVRTVKKDQERLKAIERFYVSRLRQAGGNDPVLREQAGRLVENLRVRGKWPAKPNLEEWYGAPGQRWTNVAGDFIRAVLRPEDPELLTRHEVLGNPPDLLVTNYSMLEYMLMRPLERPVFEATREWLEAHPDERLLLVVDEAHLYRGAGGTEVALLLRRLRSRLAIPPERLQVICTSASFHDPHEARVFAAQLTGKSVDEFRTIQGELALRQHADHGSEEDARALADVRLTDYYDATTDDGRIAAVEGFLAHRGVERSGDLGNSLFEALADFPPLGLLVNLTMTEALPLDELGTGIFATSDLDLADRAVTTLIALGSAARRSEGEPGLLPCRVHAFFRGLPGLWACVDPACAGSPAESPIGALYSQPREACEVCDARVFELFTCRSCGSIHLRAYTDDLENPVFVWHEPGAPFESATGRVTELMPLDLLVEEPVSLAEPAELDLVTGRVNPMSLGERNRQVFLKLDRTDADDADGGPSDPATRGEFRPCAVCGEVAGYGRSSVQDHQTKGDQPFQALVTRQIQVQPPGPQPYSEFAPLRGRKVLAFSDSRQTAARLAPNLQTYSMQDALRPLILSGWRTLEQRGLSASLALEDLYLAVLIGSRVLEVRLRPKLRETESLHAMREVTGALNRGALDDPLELQQLQLTLRSEVLPRSLLTGLVTTVADRYYGLQSLALASVRERAALAPRLLELPALPQIGDTEEKRRALARLWLAMWTGRSAGVWFQSMGPSWWKTKGGVRPHTGRFASLQRWIGDRTTQRAFESDWLPTLLEVFCEPVETQHRMRSTNLALELDGEWGYCDACRWTQRTFPGTSRCTNCTRDAVRVVDPSADSVFTARKGYYRASSIRALADPPEQPMAIIAAEHTAQLNAAQSDEVFSKAEEYELRFQDVEGVVSPSEPLDSAIDVLSCTTTMEVGIDIGALSGVALRNMPPSRASYQQRSGRAGRRGNAVATVIAFGSADSHDEHYFTEPDAMIRGRVDDPTLTLDNAEIARRHMTAFLLQRYHDARLPDIDPDEQPQLFEVLGSVDAFLAPESALNRTDFETWLRENESGLRVDVDAWLPTEIEDSERRELLDGIVTKTLEATDEALGVVARDASDAPDQEPEEFEASETVPVAESDETAAVVMDAPEEEGEEHTDPGRVSESLLQRLLYKGVLPRYAFPTDVAAFHIFNVTASTRYRPAYRYAPSQGLAVALSQYAPGKRVWVDGREWVSGALFSPISSDRFMAWRARRLYFECEVCHYARTEPYDEDARGLRRDCPACGAEESFGEGKNWLRPPGFAHPCTWEEETSPDDQPAPSYATRAKLVAPGPSDVENWHLVTPRIREHYERTHLLVTNTGPRQEGYSYCTRCGLIEPTALGRSTLAGSHPKPYPDESDQTCPGSAMTRGLVLGTDFISDVLLIAVRADPPLTLQPGLLATDTALRTVSEALTRAATRLLEIEPGELQAEYRPALTDGGRLGLEAEIYVYDTLAGGAGFARRVGELGRVVIDAAIELLEGCPANCDRSCYRCLRSFKNRFEHDLLDRHLGASLLRYLANDEEPVLPDERLSRAADKLHADLCRHDVGGAEFVRRGVVEVSGIGPVEAPILARLNGKSTIVGIHGPLTPDHVADESLRDAKELGTSVPVFLADEIVISRNLPRASTNVIEFIRGS